MKKLLIFNFIGCVLFSVGALYAAIISIQKVAKFNAQPFGVAILILFSLIQIMVVPYLFYVFNRLKKNTYKNKDILISLLFSLFVTAIIFMSNMTTAIPQYLIMSKSGLINTYFSIWLSPATLTLIGGICVSITNVILLLKIRKKNIN